MYTYFYDKHYHSGEYLSLNSIDGRLKNVWLW